MKNYPLIRYFRSAKDWWKYENTKEHTSFVYVVQIHLGEKALNFVYIWDY